MRVRAAVGVLVGAGLLLSGCGSDGVSGTADAEGAAAGEPVFSPCDDIPDDVIGRLGFDPATESRDVLGVKQPGWNICGWIGPGPALSVFATTYTLDDIRADEKFTDFAPVDLSDRSAFMYREHADTGRTRCDVAVGTTEGAALVSISYLGVDEVTEEPCAVAIRHTTALVEYFPA